MLEGCSVDRRSPWQSISNAWYEKPDRVILGCETDPHTRNSHNQCQIAKIPFFLKQMNVEGKLVKAPEPDGRKWLEVPDVSFLTIVHQKEKM